jgi:ACT domain-containing protein
MKAVITVIGKDRTGIIYNISKVLYEHNVNIEDLNQTIMQENFTMLMLVNCAMMECSFEELKAALSTAGENMGLSVRLQREDIFDAMHKV